MADDPMDIGSILRSFGSYNVASIRYTRNPLTLLVAIFGITAFFVAVVSVFAITFHFLDPLLLVPIGLIILLALVVIICVSLLVSAGKGADLTYTESEHLRIAMGSNIHPISSAALNALPTTSAPIELMGPQEPLNDQPKAEH